MHTLLDERDKVEIESQIQKISNNSIVSKKAGSSIVVNDSAGNKLRGLRVLGKTEQKTYTGKNLFRLTIEDGTVHHGVTFTVNADRSIVLNGTPTVDIYLNIGVALLEGGTEYTISGCPVFDSWDNAGFYVNSDAYSGDVWNRTKESTFAMPDTKEYNCTIQLKKDLVLTNVMFYPMIRLATIADATYEPYVGGITSPNPDYPQELVSVGDDGSVEVGVLGKNLFKIKKGVIPSISNGADVPTGDGSVSSDFIRVDKNKDYTSSTSKAYEQLFLLAYDANKNYLGFSNVQPNIFEKLKRSYPNLEYVRARYDGVSDGTYQFEVGSSATEYEPYNEQPLTIPTPNGLPGIPVTDASLATYTDENGQMWCADEVDFECGVYVQRVGKYVFDGSSDENWVLNDGTSIGNRYYITITNNKILVSDLTNGVTSLNSNFQITVSSGTWRYKNVYAISDNNIIVSLNGSETLNEFKEYLSNNPMTVQCILSTPIETDLTPEEIAAYKALTMNYPTTTILNDSNAHMEVSYVANTQNHIEQNYLTKDEFESLKTRISSIANNII